MSDACGANRKGLATLPPAGPRTEGGRRVTARFGGRLALPLAVLLTAGAIVTAHWAGVAQPSPLAFTPTIGAPVPAGTPLRLAVVGQAAASAAVERQVGDLIGLWRPHLLLDIDAELPTAAPAGILPASRLWASESSAVARVPEWVPRFGSITDPVIGGSSAIRAHGDKASLPPQSYSINTHGWHIAVVDSTSADFAAGAPSPTYRWLRRDLAAAKSRCTLVAASAPLLALDPTGATRGTTSYWRLVTRYRVTAVVGAQAHNYQRWQRLDGVGEPRRTGASQFVVGTTGTDVAPFAGRDPRMATALDTTAARGALLLDLGEAGATFRFQALDGATKDYGSLPCRGAPDRTPPAPASALTATARSSSRVDLSWRPAVDDVGVTFYRILRDGTPIGTVPGYRSTFTDATTLSTSTYHYAVVAADAAGNHTRTARPAWATTPPGPPVFRQANATSTGLRVTSATIRLSAPVRAGELLVGWFGQYDAPGQVSVSDNRDGRWSRIRGEWFGPGVGDVGLFYTFAVSDAPLGLTVRLGSSSRTYLQAAVATYWGVAPGRHAVSASVACGTGRIADSGTTLSVARGTLVFAALMTGGVPGRTIVGRSAGVGLKPRAATDTGSVSAADVTSARTGPQRAVFHLAAGTDWRAAIAAFRAAADVDTTPPGAAGAVTADGDPVVVRWVPPPDRDLAGFDVYRDHVLLGSVGARDVSFTDPDAAPSTRYTYTVVALDGAGNRSSPSTPATVTTLPPTPVYLQGGVVATPNRVASAQLRLGRPVDAGDLLVGWFAQYDARGSVRVSDPVNGVWTPLRGMTFADGNGDMELFAVRSAAAPSGMTVSVGASEATYLQGGAVDYRPRSAVSLASSSVDSGAAAVADSGPSAPAPTGALVVTGLITGWQPQAAAPAASAGVQPKERVSTNSDSVVLADVRSARPGVQNGRFQLAGAGTWYAMCVVFQR